jgi:hypothetical protein
MIFLKGVKANSFDLWMDKYYRENPLKTISKGAFKLVEQQTAGVRQ